MDRWIDQLHKERKSGDRNKSWKKEEKIVLGIGDWGLGRGVHACAARHYALDVAISIRVKTS